MATEKIEKIKSIKPFLPSIIFILAAISLGIYGLNYTGLLTLVNPDISSLTTLTLNTSVPTQTLQTQTKTTTNTITQTVTETVTSTVTQLVSSNPVTTTVTVTQTTTPTITSSPAKNILINEIQASVAEFVELYNPNDVDVDLSSYYLAYYAFNRDWNEPSNTWKFPQGSKILARDVFLIKVYKLEGDADWTLLTAQGAPYAEGRFNNIQGSVAIFSFDPLTKSAQEAKEARIDAVGWGNPEIVFESKAAEAPDAEESIQRIDFQDTNNNFNDFIISGPSPGT